MKNVLELKTKKMSLASIDGRLTPAEMENIMAGSGRSWSFNGTMSCYLGLAGMGFGFAAVLSGAGTAAGLSLLISIAGTMPECFHYD